jgi:hypothetical protein
MSARRSRHLAIQALVRGSSLFTTNPELSQVDAELEELGRCNALQPVKRQRLLQVIHSTRALDTSLLVVLRHHGKDPKYSIGKMLHQLPSLPSGAVGHLTHNAVVGFVGGICGLRNRYAHKAGAFPTSTLEVDGLVARIHSCILAIL